METERREEKKKGKNETNERKKDCVTHFMFHSLLFSGAVIFSLHRRHTSAIF